MLKVKDVMVTNVVTTAAELSVREAVRRMNRNEIGCLVVLKEERFVGIVTERDVLRRVVAESLSPDETLVEDVMSTSLAVVGPEASLEEATFMMLERRVKKLPVVDNEQLVGIVTLTDIARIARAKGLRKLESADLQASIVVSPQKVRVGEDVSLDIELLNAGKGPALLIRMEGAIPEEFKLIKKPRNYRADNGNLDLRGKRLAPLRSEQVRLTVRPTEGGSFTLKPQVIYLDESGKYKTLKPEPGYIEVSKVVLPSRITTGHTHLDNLLFGGIPENYAVILSSPSCDEKDQLVRNFIEAGISEEQTTFYVTTRMSEAVALAEEASPSLFLFACNPQADATLPDLPNVIKLKGVENLTDINISLALAFRRLTNTKRVRRACVDVISDALLQHRAVQTRRWLSGVIPELGLQRFTTLAVMDPGMHPAREVSAIASLFQGEIEIHERETEKGARRFLKIKRMYNQRYLESELILRKRPSHRKRTKPPRE